MKTARNIIYSYTEFYSYMSRIMGLEEFNRIINNYKWFEVLLDGEKPLFFVEHCDSYTNLAFFSIQYTKLKKLEINEKGNRILHTLSIGWPEYTRAQLIYSSSYSNEFLQFVITNLSSLADIIVIIQPEDQAQITKIWLDAYKYKYYYLEKTPDNRLCDMNIVLPCSSEQLLDRFQRKQHHQYNKNNINRVIKKLEKTYNVSYSFIDCTIKGNMYSKSIISDISRVYQHSWQVQQSTTYFDNIQKIAEFLWSDNSLFGIVVYVDSLPVSYVISRLKDKVIQNYWTAYDVQYYSFSVGKIAFIKYLYACIEAGVSVVSCGGTSHKYKVDLVNQVIPKHEINIFCESLMGKRLNIAKRINPNGML